MAKKGRGRQQQRPPQATLLDFLVDVVFSLRNRHATASSTWHGGSRRIHRSDNDDDDNNGSGNDSSSNSSSISGNGGGDGDGGGRGLVVHLLHFAVRAPFSRLLRVQPAQLWGEPGLPHVPGRPAPERGAAVRGRHVAVLCAAKAREPRGDQVRRADAPGKGGDGDRGGDVGECGGARLPARVPQPGLPVREGEVAHGAVGRGSCALVQEGRRV
mmetsp:Transcript_22332/g.40871  ORF Transcript_22332/g.40871 Transcript_22332/m.40871 type:complete len:214 (-) Transcript_22332:508-1149(-)